MSERQKVRIGGLQPPIPNSPHLAPPLGITRIMRGIRPLPNLEMIPWRSDRSTVPRNARISAPDGINGRDRIDRCTKAENVDDLMTYHAECRIILDVVSDFARQ